MDLNEESRTQDDVMREIFRRNGGVLKPYDETKHGKGLFGDGRGDFSGLCEVIQAIVLAIVAGGVFLGSWVYAVASWGWFLGLSLGWLPSAILAAMAGYIAFHLWWIVLSLIGLVVLAWAMGV